MEPHTRVICLGNELVCDDGIGIRVGRVLRALPLPVGVVVELRPALGLELLDELRGGQHLVLVDATRTGAAPGTCRTLTLAEAALLARTPFCCHGVGIAEVLQLAARVAPERLPAGVSVVGVEADVLDRFDTALTPPVQAALPAAVGAVLGLVGAPAALVARGEEEAKRPEYGRVGLADLGLPADG